MQCHRRARNGSLLSAGLRRAWAAASSSGHWSGYYCCSLSGTLGSSGPSSLVSLGLEASLWEGDSLSLPGRGGLACGRED